MSESTLRVAAVQMTTGPEVEANLDTAAKLVARAAGMGARFVVLPERWNLIDEEQRQVAAAEDLDGPSLRAARDWARAHRISIVAGSIAERIAGSDRAFNTSVMIDPDGAAVAVYRKLHLFDVEVGGRTYRESDGSAAGAEIVVGSVAERRVGLSVCYDLRFPELFRAMTFAGAEVFAVPAAFTAITGAAHWEPLLRARAIENQAFVVAAAQVGVHATGASSFGHSLIVDPWGVVLAEATGAGPDVLVADLNFDDQADVRATLPALRHTRPEVYGQPGG